MYRVVLLLPNSLLNIHLKKQSRDCCQISLYNLLLLRLSTHITPNFSTSHMPHLCIIEACGNFQGRPQDSTYSSLQQPANSKQYYISYYPTYPKLHYNHFFLTVGGNLGFRPFERVPGSTCSQPTPHAPAPAPAPEDRMIMSECETSFVLGNAC